MKLARSEIKLALAYFVTAFDFTAVDQNGKEYTAETLPPPARMGHLRKPCKPLFLNYTLRTEQSKAVPV